MNLLCFHFSNTNLSIQLAINESFHWSTSYSHECSIEISYGQISYDRKRIIRMNRFGQKSKKCSLPWPKLLESEELFESFVKKLSSAHALSPVWNLKSPMFRITPLSSFRPAIKFPHSYLNTTSNVEAIQPCLHYSYLSFVVARKHSQFQTLWSIESYQVSSSYQV